MIMVGRGTSVAEGETWTVSTGPVGVVEGAVVSCAVGAPVCVRVAVGGTEVLVEVGSGVFVSSGGFVSVGVFVDTGNVFVIVGVSLNVWVTVGDGDPVFVGVEVGVSVGASVPGVTETGSL
jgi:hypothetical protein